jgi:FkbM family methyltransferase
MNFLQKIGVMLRYPDKLLPYGRYSISRIMYGGGVAKIPRGGRIYTSSFSEYLSVYGLMPDQRELNMIQTLLPRAAEVFDLGANVGVWTVLMNKTNPAVRIHSFEPSPKTHNLLEKNIKLNECPNIILNRVAVSDADGEISFEVPENASIFGRVAPRTAGHDEEGRFSNARSFSVPAVRLAQYCQAHSIREIDFLKIDVEGHELAALKGLEPLLSQRKVKAMYIETMKANHDRMGTSFSELLKFITDCGYRFYILSEDGNAGEAVPPDQIKAHNHLCLPV